MALLVLGLHAAWAPSDPVSMASGVANASAGDGLAPFWSDSDFAPANSNAAKAEPEGVVYSYSVIPGGVTSAQKLRVALQHDPIAAAHYSDFHVESAYVVRLARDRKVHVSYRLGDRIFWTKKEVTLRAGETLLSDGEHLARTRCGNRIAAVPDGPTSPLEPPVEVIDRPVFPHPPAITTDAIPAAPIWSDQSTPILLAYGGVPVGGAPAGGPPYLPPVPIGAPCCGASTNPTKGGGSQPPSPPPSSPQPPPPGAPLPPPVPPPNSGTTPNPPSTPGQPTPPSTTPPSSPTPPTEPTPPSNPFPTPPGPPPPTPTPEPSSLLLLVIGLAGALLLLKTRRL
jgi:hypothetical protein